MCDELTPQQRLANIVAEETDGGRRVVRFFVQVAEGELDHQDFKPNHRMDAAKELVKVGLTEFDDYIRANSARRAPRSRRPVSDPEMEQARQELAQYARELTDGGRTVIKLYSEVMDGLRNDEGFKPHHRIAAGRELLRRGFDYECDHATPTVVPAKAGTQQATGATTPEVRPETDSTESAQLIIDDSELIIDEEPVDYVAMAKEIVASLDPADFEEEPPSNHKPELRHVGHHRKPASACHYRGTRQNRSRPVQRRDAETATLGGIQPKDPNQEGLLQLRRRLVSHPQKIPSSSTGEG